MQSKKVREPPVAGECRSGRELGRSIELHAHADPIGTGGVLACINGTHRAYGRAFRHQPVHRVQKSPGRGTDWTPQDIQSKLFAYATTEKLVVALSAAIGTELLGDVPLQLRRD